MRDGHLGEQVEGRVQVGERVLERVWLVSDLGLLDAKSSLGRVAGGLRPVTRGAIDREDDGGGLPEGGDRRSLFRPVLVAQPPCEPVAFRHERVRRGREQLLRFLRNLHGQAATRRAG